LLIKKIYFHVAKSAVNGFLSSQLHFELITLCAIALRRNVL